VNGVTPSTGLKVASLTGGFLLKQETLFS
jgi:hypothetical protein